MNNPRQMVPVMIVMAILLSSLPYFAFADQGLCLTLNSSLSIGSTDTTTNGAVTKLQVFLRTQDLFSIDSTGYFGQITEAAVINFQAKENLPTVGVVGPLSRAMINKMSCAPKVSASEPQSIVGTSQSASLINAVSSTPTTTVPQPQPDQSPKLPYQTETFSNWEGTWGNVSIAPSGGLLLKAGTTTSGAEAIFKDSTPWTDYRYTANVIVSNSGIVLISRFADEDNFIFCDFSSNWISIRERFNGQTTTLTSATVAELPSGQFFAKSTAVSMRVKGNTIGCSELGGEDNVTYTITNNPIPKGGIGISIWGVEGAANLLLQSVKVEAI